MNTLRLENINLHAPYRVMQDPQVFMLVADDDVRDHAHTRGRETERRTHPRGSIYK
ncbi:MAG: hypothetical protein K6E15_03020 [Prevotella sp.]|jgi:hypothetical protein|nr:hypothetical protein [Prevotella sp.]